MGGGELTSLWLAGLVFVLICLATFAGMLAQRRLPDHHLNADSKEVIRLATAIVGTLAALALGLLIASANSTYNDADVEMRSSVAHMVLLDRVMARYGPETAEARNLLRSIVERRLNGGWSTATLDDASPGPANTHLEIETIQSDLRALTPGNDVQRSLQSRAIEIGGKIAEAHWLLIENSDEGLPWAFMAVLVFWLALLFATFGLQSPMNVTVVLILVVCALSVAGAIFLISDMAGPYDGIIRLSPEPLRSAFLRLGQP